MDNLNTIPLQFIIIGGQKCGSTFIHHICSAHPEVFIPRAEITFFEKHYFNAVDRSGLHRYYEKRNGETCIGLKRPSYLSLEECPRNIHQLYPDIKLIAILRDPVERAMSAYFHYLNGNYLPPIGPEEGFELIFNQSLDEKYKRSYEILDFGFYGKAIEAYLDVFDRDQLLLLDFRNFKKDKSDLIKKVYQFLNVDDSFYPEQVVNSRPMKGNYSISKTRFALQQIRRDIQFKDDDTKTRKVPSNNPIRKYLGKGLGYVNKKIFTNDSKSPEISDTLRNKLIDLYREDDQKLKELTGISFFS